MTNLEILNGTEGEGDSHLGELSGMVQSEPAEVQLIETGVNVERSAWFEQHKTTIAAIGGTVLATTGIVIGSLVARHRVAT